MCLCVNYVSNEKKGWFSYLQLWSHLLIQFRLQFSSQYLELLKRSSNGDTNCTPTQILYNHFIIKMSNLYLIIQVLPDINNQLMFDHCYFAEFEYHRIWKTPTQGKSKPERPKPNNLALKSLCSLLLNLYMKSF